MQTTTRIAAGLRSSLWASFGLCALPLVARAQETAAPVVAQSSWDRLFNTELPDAFAKGKLNLSIRARYEYADQDGLEASNAPTVRTLLGYETASFHGFTFMGEFEDVHIFGDDESYNQAGLTGAGKTPVNDVESTELNQAWASYDQWDSTLRLGRQRINLDNQRFIGDVAWRQHDQTFDSLLLENRSAEHLQLLYTYIDNVNRIFTDEHPKGNFRSDSHVLHAVYDGLPYGKLTAYAYLLDFQNSAVNSTDTYGLSFAGKRGGETKNSKSLSYRAEYAYQTDAADNPAHFAAQYYTLELGGEVQRFNFGGGYEVLGSDNNVGFSTPLATLHAFNGWADIFLVTPAQGLADLYVWAGVMLPREFPFKIIYHDFESDAGSQDFGSEWDALLSKKLGAHWSALLKYAMYDAAGGPYADTERFWAQLQFSI